MLHVITGLFTGGAEHALLRLCEHGTGDGLAHAVVSLRSHGSVSPLLRAAGAQVFSLEMRAGLPDPLALLRLRRVVRAVAPAVLQGWMYHGNLAAVLARRWAPRGTALAWNVVHSLHDLRRESRLLRWVIRGNRALSGKPSAIVYNSAVSRSQHESYGFAREPGCVIPDGFDLERFRPDARARSAVRAELGIPPDALVVGRVARLHPVKDYPGLLDALAPVMGGDGSVHALLVGRDVARGQPALAPGLARLPANRVHLPGERRDVERLMAAMDVAVSSSRGEAFPNVIAEAMACGVPCVSTDVGDSAAIIGDTGLVVPPSDPTALSEALRCILALPAGERAALGRAARQRVEANYSIGACIGSYRSLYERLVR